MASTIRSTAPVMRPVDPQHPGRPMTQAEIDRVNQSLQQRNNGDYIDFYNPDPVYDLQALAKGTKALATIAAPAVVLASDGVLAPILAETEAGSATETAVEFGKELVKSQVVDWVRQGIGTAVTAAVGYAAAHLHRDAPKPEKTNACSEK